MKGDGSDETDDDTLGTIFDQGLFVFEKYAKVTPNDPSIFSEIERGIVNLETFHSINFQNSLGITSTDVIDVKISDHFGDLEVVTDSETEDETLSGETNGISYGIRISYMPPSTLTSQLEDFKNEQTDITSLSKLLSGIYLNNPYNDGTTTHDNTNYLFPLVSVEIDLPDLSISELDGLSSDDFDTRTDSNGVLYYDCLLSKLLNSDE